MLSIVIYNDILYFIDTAYCKNKESNKWYSFDDSHVSAVDESAICVSST